MSGVGDTVAGRTVHELKEKWGCLKKKIRDGQSARRKTGNGAVPVSPYDRLIEEIVGRDSDLVEGVSERTYYICILFVFRFECNENNTCCS